MIDTTPVRNEMAIKKEKARIFEKALNNQRVENDNVRMLSKFIEI